MRIHLWSQARALPPLLAALGESLPEASWIGLPDDQPLPRGRDTLLRVQPFLSTLTRDQWAVLRQAAAGGWRVGVLLDPTRSQSREEVLEVLEEIREGFGLEGFDPGGVLEAAPLLSSIAGHPGYGALARLYALPSASELGARSGLAEMRRFLLDPCKPAQRAPGDRTL